LGSNSPKISGKRTGPSLDNNNTLNKHVILLLDITLANNDHFFKILSFLASAINLQQDLVIFFRR